MKHDMHAMHTATGTTEGTAVLEVKPQNCHNASDQAGLEAHLQKLEGVMGVHLDRTWAVAPTPTDEWDNLLGSKMSDLSSLQNVHALHSLYHPVT